MLLTSLASFCLSAVIVMMLWQTPFWHLVEKRSFDIATVLFPPDIESTDIIIVGIDDASFGQLNQPWPWPRAWHGQLLDRLNRAGARSVLFDLILDTPSRFGLEDDYTFAQSIANYPFTYLGYYQQHLTLAEGYQIVSVEPLPIFRQAGARLANVAIIPDEDGTVRQQPAYADALWRQVNDANDHKQEADLPRSELTRFIGDANSFPFVSYYRALETDLVPDSIFKDKIVLVGLNILAPASVGLQDDDRYLTPFSIASKQLMTGVELHANFIESARHNLTIQRATTEQFLGLVILINFIACLVFLQWRALRSAAIWATGGVLIVAMQWHLFTQGLYFPLFSLLLVWSSNYLIQGGFAFRKERAERRFITTAFSRYVSTQVLEELIKQPENLSLGGSRKSVTVMFTDLEGFTQLSESLAPEHIATLLQDYLTKMSAIVVKHGGTLDKYIGDAIMAFWGAPLPDKQQANRALNAAVEMQQTCKELSEELNIALNMRIGIHSGDAIVGNMGSETLFDYTCIGDNVNTAARLESINKQYATNILISETVKQGLTEPHYFQLIDFVVLKGKKRPTKIYTPVSDQHIALLSENGFNCYVNQHWDDAEYIFNSMIQETVSNTSGKLFLQRIAMFKREGVPNNWDGSVRAQEK